MQYAFYSEIDVMEKQSGHCMIHSESYTTTQLQTHSTKHNKMPALCSFSKAELTLKHKRRY